jgi:hypothetical protein
MLLCDLHDKILVARKVAPISVGITSCLGRTIEREISISGLNGPELKRKPLCSSFLTFSISNAARLSSRRQQIVKICLHSFRGGRFKILVLVRVGLNPQTGQQPTA